MVWFIIHISIKGLSAGSVISLSAVQHISPPTGSKGEPQLWKIYWHHHIWKYVYYKYVSQMKIIIWIEVYLEQTLYVVWSILIILVLFQWCISDYISLFYEVSISSLSAVYKGKESDLWDGISLYTNSMILKVFSQQLSYTSLEQHGAPSQKKKA